MATYAADRNPFKHGRYTPGVRIPVVPPEHLIADAPDDVLVLPWNLRDEIAAQLAASLKPGTRLIWPMPTLDIDIFGVRNEGRTVLRRLRDAHARAEWRGAAEALAARG